MIGKILGHYRVVEQIGAGGMGLVFLAHDERLDRDVALKVLPPGTLTDENARRRFRKEALTLSKLNHPNIETVFDFDTQEGVDFLVMELIPGVTLDEKLSAGALPEKAVIRLGTQLAEGLAAAHAEGVVHRDLKPGNLRLTPDGRLKILDFGLAKLLRPVSDAAPTESLSQTRGAVGTLPYMAPEQLQGEPADARSDIWAAGAVLYEMATGKRPFAQESAPMLTDAILRQAPVPPRALNANLSPELERILYKSLEKDPERRYQAAKELGVDLRRLGLPVPASLAPASPARSVRRWVLVAAGLLAILAGTSLWLWLRPPAKTGPPHIESLAVLPLANLSGDPQQEYFTDGMTEELIAELARIHSLRVISRTSVMQYKGTRRPLPEIARELNVDAVVEGSVLRSGERVRITAQLIHAPTDRHLWAQSYERDLRDVLTLQSEVARDIADRIQITLTSQEESRLAAARPVNPEAHEAYLEGRSHIGKPSEKEVQKGIEYFQRSIEIDPGYAPAYAGLAEAYYLISSLHLAPREAMPKAKSAATKALELDETLADAHLSLALVKAYYDWDWVGAEKEFKRAIELNPSSASAHEWYGLYLAYLQRMDAANAELKRARELNPLSVWTYWAAGMPYYFLRQYDPFIAHLRKVIELDRNFSFGPWGLAKAHVQQGKFPEAIAELEQTRRLDDSPQVWGDIGYVYAVSGNKSKAYKAIEQLKNLSRQRYVSLYDIAIIYGALGDKDQAFAWLEKAFDARDEQLTWLKVDPRLDPLRSDPRFANLMRRMGLSQ